MATNKRKTTEALSDRALFDLATEFETGKERVKKYEGAWRAAQERIVKELKRRKVKFIGDDTLTKITLVAPESVVYDSDGLWADLTPAKRKLVFDRNINLSALPKDVQADLLKHLTPAQRKRVVTHRLNEDRLAQAVQDGKVDVETISEHSEIKESSPYIRVSHGSSA